MRAQLHQHYNNVPGRERVFHALESGTLQLLFTAT
jgi:hypothetical protein